MLLPLTPCNYACTACNLGFLLNKRLLCRITCFLCCLCFLLFADSLRSSDLLPLIACFFALLALRVGRRRLVLRFPSLCFFRSAVTWYTFPSSAFFHLHVLLALALPLPSPKYTLSLMTRPHPAPT